MEYKAVYSKKAQKDLKALESKIAARIVTKIRFYRQQKAPLTFAQKLKNPIIGKYRFRIGNYRAVFDIDEKGNIIILIILRIKHRKDIYGL